MHQAGDERTFHIFYQCLSGMDDSEKEEFVIQDAKTYKFLSNGNLPVPGVNDGQEFEDTKEAMNIMSMSEDEQNCMFIVPFKVVFYQFLIKPFLLYLPLFQLSSVSCLLFSTLEIWSSNRRGTPTKLSSLITQWPKRSPNCSASP